MTEPKPVQQIDRTYVRVGSKELSYFSGCDYFRLASDPRVIKALHRGVEEYGLNVAASRLTTGNNPLYRKLEKRLARFFGAQEAVLVSSGYMTGMVAAQALAGNYSHALIDRAAHPALTDAARFLDCPLLDFKHRDPADLARTVARCGPGAKLIVLTDGMFSRDGSAAPLRAYLKVLPVDATILLDDSHAVGVLGKNGRGTLEHEGVGRRRIVQNVTLSKAFGCYGGAILCNRQLRGWILQHSPAFIGSTPLPLPLAAASLRALEIIDTHPGLRHRLGRNTDYVRAQLRGAGIPASDNPGPIVPVFPKDPRQMQTVRSALLRAGIYPALTRYPGAPQNGYFRFVISSEHTRTQLDKLTRALISALAKN